MNEFNMIVLNVAVIVFIITLVVVGIILYFSIKNHSFHHLIHNVLHIIRLILVTIVYLTVISTRRQEQEVIRITLSNQLKVVVVLFLLTNFMLLGIQMMKYYVQKISGQPNAEYIGMA